MKPFLLQIFPGSDILVFICTHFFFENPLSQTPLFYIFLLKYLFWAADLSFKSAIISILLINIFSFGYSKLFL